MLKEVYQIESEIEFLKLKLMCREARIGKLLWLQCAIEEELANRI